MNGLYQPLSVLFSHLIPPQREQVDRRVSELIIVPPTQGNRAALYPWAPSSTRTLTRDPRKCFGAPRAQIWIHWSEVPTPSL